MSVEIVILVDNAAGSDALRTEHGLSILVSGPGRKVLFDAGASPEVLLANAESLGVDLSSVDAVVVSHGHSDHTGGLAAVAQKRPGLNVYVHQAAFSRRWVDRPGEPLRDVSCPHTVERLCQAGATFRAVSAPEQLDSWLLVSGPIGGPKHGRDVFVVRKAGEMVVDGFEDEMCLMARGQAGWALLTGCCHRGLKNTLRLARFLARGEPLVGLIGGLHLRKAGDEELDETIELLRQYDVQGVYPCHCTGDQATQTIRSRLPGQIHPVAAGSRVVF